MSKFRSNYESCENCIEEDISKCLNCKYKDCYLCQPDCYTTAICKICYDCFHNNGEKAKKIGVKIIRERSKMEIYYLNNGGVAEPDKFIGMNSCCHEMAMSVICNEQMQILEKAQLYLLPSKKIVEFCPFCGKKVKRIRRK